MKDKKIYQTVNALFDKQNNRLADNIELVKILTDLVNTNPDLRFSQILANFDFVKQIPQYHHEVDEIIGHVWLDEYNLEPSELLERVKNSHLKVNSNIKN